MGTDTILYNLGTEQITANSRKKTRAANLLQESGRLKNQVQDGCKVHGTVSLERVCACPDEHIKAPTRCLENQITILSKLGVFNSLT